MAPYAIISTRRDLNCGSSVLSWWELRECAKLQIAYVYSGGMGGDISVDSLQMRETSVRVRRL